jgi:hypothetical protein
MAQPHQEGKARGTERSDKMNRSVQKLFVAAWIAAFVLGTLAFAYAAFHPNSAADISLAVLVVWSVFPIIFWVKYDKRRNPARQLQHGEKTA